ncbi:MAG: APC family permease [bacterium]|nr:APC family permease [bacterium]
MSDQTRRRLGTPSLGAIVAANMIGAGVFTTSGFALGDLGSPGWVMVAWLLGGVLAIAGSLCYGALAARLSESGGEYLFLSRTLHPSIGFLAGWVSIWAGFTGAIALAAEAAQVYLGPWLPAGLAPDWIGSGVIVLAGLLHTRGVGPATWVQNSVVTIKVVLLLVLVGVGAAQLAPQPEPVASSFSFATFAATMMWISLSYSGWNGAVYVAGEARDPKRTLPRSMLFATLVVTALYLALNWVFLHSAPVDQLAGRKDVAAIAARNLGGAGLENLVRVVLVIALLTSVSSMVMIGPRVMARMADDGLLPRKLAFTGKVPTAAIWTQVILAVGVLWASGLRQQLTNLGWILSLFTALTVIGLMRLRRTEGPARLPIPGYPWIPAFFLLATLGLTCTMVFVRGSQLLPALSVLFSGAVLYAIQRRTTRS